jgi:phosphotransferase system enzyme I (PtsP)
MAEMARPPTRPRVHARGDERLDGVLDFVAFAARPMPLGKLLDDAPPRIAALLGAQVCSLYLLEGGEGELVMRGNVGFDSAAIGEVRLRVGQGITGEAVEYMRPISTHTAEQHAAYRHFAELGEERYPVFLAVPIRGRSGPLGALVVQRERRAFRAADVELLTVIGGLIAAGIRHAELADEAREKRARRAGGSQRKVTLTGRPVMVGRALGSIAALRRPRARAGGRAEAPRDRRAGQKDVQRLRSAFDVAEKSIRGLHARAGAIGLGRDASFLGTYLEILQDGRFRERAHELAASGVGLPGALSSVARDVTRTAAAVTDPFLEERARDVEDLCDALTMLAQDDQRPALPSKAILVGDGLTVFDLLVSARSLPAGMALSERAAGPRTKALLKLLNVPAVSDVHGLFRWATDGDIALLDGDHGLLVINPSKSEVASLREQRRASGES